MSNPESPVHLATTSAFKRRRRLLAAARGLGATSLFLFMLAFVIDFQIHTGYGVLPFVLSVLLGIGGLFPLVFASLPDPRGRLARVVRIVGKQAVGVSQFGAPLPSVSLANAVSGWRESPSKVALSMRNGDLHELELGDPNEATALLQRLSVAEGDHALRMPLARQTAPSAVGRALAFGMMLFSSAGVALAGVHDITQRFEVVKLFVLVLFLGGMLASSLWLQRALHKLEHGEVVVGLDGLVITTAGATRFVPMVEVVGARLSGASVIVDRRRREGGPDEQIVLPMADTGEPDAARAMALTTAINVAAKRCGAPSTTLGAVLERGKKTAREWKADLARSQRAEADYRSTALGPEELGALVVDPTAPPDRRVGAAVALAKTSPDEARAKVRIATLAMAGDDLKASLEAAAEGEIDERHLARSMRLYGRHED